MTEPRPENPVPVSPEPERNPLREAVLHQLWLAGVRVGLDVCADAAMAAFADRVPASSEPRKITHGRHCICSACAAEDWTNPQLACCGMHGPSCPREYAPLGGAGQRVPSSEPRPENPYPEHTTSSDDYWPTHHGFAAWNEGFASRQPEIDRLEAERDRAVEKCESREKTLALVESILMQYQRGESGESFVPAERVVRPALERIVDAIGPVWQRQPVSGSSEPRKETP